MLIISGDHVRRALSMKNAIDLMKEAFAAFSSGKAQIPQRLALDIAPRNGVVLFMPAYVQDDIEILTAKIVSVYPDNINRQLPAIYAEVLVLEPQTGRLLAIMDGQEVTSKRTGAAAGAATDMLSRPDARTLAIIGAGVQGKSQFEAVCAVREIQHAWIYDIQPQRASEFAESMQHTYPNIHIQTTQSPKDAIVDADIICTATTSSQPVFSANDVKKGTHINAIGAFTPKMCEIPSEIIAQAKVFVDSLDAAKAEAGDIIQAIDKGVFTWENVAGEIGEVVLGQKQGRIKDDEITVFKSVGIAVQDAYAAHAILKNALSLGLGNRITW